MDEAELVVVAEVAETGPQGGRVRVTETLSGGPCPEALSVHSPPYHRALAVGWAPLAPGDRVVLFLKGAGDQFVVVADGLGSMKLPEGEEAAEVDGIRRTIAILGLDEDARNRAMLAAVTDANPRLRAEAAAYVVSGLRRTYPHDKYWKELSALLDAPDAETRITALRAMRNMQLPQAVPKLLKLTVDPDAKVARDAVETVGKYRSPEVLARLLQLADSPDWQMRYVVLWHFYGDERKEAIEAATRMLSDPDGRVRRQAPRPFGYWLRKGMALEAIPKLVSLLGDNEPGVGSAAADVFGFSGRQEAVEALLEVLRREKPAAQSYGLATVALEHLYSGGEEPIHRRIAAERALIVEALNSGSAQAPHAAAWILGHMDDPAATAALRDAARNHADPEVRELAAKLLKEPAEH